MEEDMDKAVGFLVARYPDVEFTVVSVSIVRAGCSKIVSSIEDKFFNSDVLEQASKSIYNEAVNDRL